SLSPLHRHPPPPPLFPYTTLFRSAAGAIEDRASLGPAIDGVDAVIHVAGIVKARKPADFFAVNTQGTKNLLEAALARGGVKRFRSEEHTSELQSRSDLVCRLLLEK